MTEEQKNQIIDNVNNNQCEVSNIKKINDNNFVDNKFEMLNQNQTPEESIGHQFEKDCGDRKENYEIKNSFK